MSATVYGTARYGTVNDATATGLHLANFSTSSEVEEAMAKNHIGCDVALALYNDGATVDCDGVVTTKTAGVALNLASVLSLSNVTADSLNTTTANLFTTPVANAGLLVKSVNLTRGNSAFEEGSISSLYKPLIATNSPTVLTD